VKTIRYPIRSLENMVSFIFERAIYTERLVSSPRGYGFQFLGNLQTYYITRIKQMAFGREMRVKPSEINQELIMGLGPLLKNQ
jgi:hypothetical protein